MHASLLLQTPQAAVSCVCQAAEQPAVLRCRIVLTRSLAPCCQVEEVALKRHGSAEAIEEARHKKLDARLSHKLKKRKGDAEQVVRLDGAAFPLPRLPALTEASCTC